MEKDLDIDWIEYKCNSGQTFFLYNKVTGEQRWPHIGKGIEYKVTYDPLAATKEFATIGTQTDDNGCNNGCMSMYANAGPSCVSSTSRATLLQHQPGVSNASHQPGPRNVLPAQYVITSRSPMDKRRDDVSKSVDNPQDPNEILKLLNVLHETASSLNTSSTSNEHVRMNSGGQQHMTMPQQQHEVLPYREIRPKKTANNITKSFEGIGRSTFECQYCPKKFNHRGQFNRHVRVHTGEKPFECTLCKRRFAEKDSLVKHTRVHTKEKPFPCPHCEKRFSRKDHLKTHVKIHTGEKPFQCTICSKKFAQKGNLRLHSKVHRKDKT